MLGTLLGIWPFVIFFAGFGYGPLYNALEKFSFVKAYSVVAAIILICGFVMLAFDKRFMSLVKDEDDK